MHHFVELVPQGNFEQGIFVPFNSLDEALRQVACELDNGSDPDMYVGIFESENRQPRFGWVAGKIEESPHLDPDNRKKTHSKSQLMKAANPLIKVLREEQKKATEDWLLSVQANIRSGRDLKASVPGNAYTWCTGGTATATPKALSAATAATLVLALAAAANQPSVVEVGVSFDGVTASAVPVLVELVSGTAGGAGTPRAALAAGKQTRGWPAQTSQTTAGDNYTAEPTTQLVNRKWFVTPNGGLFVVQFPLGREPTGIVTAATDAKTWSIRATAPATVNAHAYIEWEE